MLRDLWKWLWQEDADSLELQPLQPSVSEIQKKLYDLESHESEFSTKSSATNRCKEFLFPSDLPEEVQLLRFENLAIPVSYLLVGAMQGMVIPLLNVYPLDLGATESQQTTLYTVAILPASFKLIYGFLSDNLPVAGCRRKPYMFAGWMTASLIMLALRASTDLSLTYQGEKAVPPEHPPSVQWLGAAFFLFGVGVWCADVMADSMVAQKARLEPEQERGNLQSTCYTILFFGLMVSAPVSTFLYSNYGPASVVQCLMFGPLFELPLAYLMGEQRNYPIKPTREQCAEIWKTVCSRSVWQPLGFIYLFNLLQIPNAAWRQFLKSVLGFTAAQLNFLLVVSCILLYVGTISYKLFLLKSSWRRVYQVCILLNGFFSALQLLLVRGYTFGLSPFLFALGDQALAQFVIGLQFLPCAILMVSLCPPGSEGASYAMFTTVWNSAQMLAPAIGSQLLAIWDVSKETLQAGNLDGLFKLTILTTIIQLSPILIIGWLPHTRDDLYALGGEGSFSTSKLGGSLFLVVLFGSMSYTLLVGILNIVTPGWSGGS